MFVEMRKAALIAGVMASLAIPIPLWNAARPMFALRANPAWMWWGDPTMGLIGLITLTLPLFYLCLFLEPAAPLLSERLKALSLAGAIALCVVTALGLQAWVRTLGARSVPSIYAPQGGSILNDLSIVLGSLSNLASALPLVALYAANANEFTPQEVISLRLRRVSLVAAIGWGLVAALAGLRLFLSPVINLHYRANPKLAGLLTGKLLWKGMGTEAEFLLGQFGLFVAPYVVWRGGSRASNSIAREIEE